MKAIENEFEEYYFLTEDGKVYNSNTKQYLKPYKHSYKLKTVTGTIQSISLKKLYKLVYNKIYCIDNIQNLNNEIWKEIENTDGNYYISNKGRVKSYTGYNAIILRPAVIKNGYERLQISKNGILVNKLIHRLVASAFLPAPKNIDEVLHHKDGNKRNNNADNLQWLSVAEHLQIHNEQQKGENETDVKSC